jgi:hypothetical protein
MADTIDLAALRQIAETAKVCADAITAFDSAGAEDDSPEQNRLVWALTDAHNEFTAAIGFGFACDEQQVAPLVASFLPLFDKITELEELLRVLGNRQIARDHQLAESQAGLAASKERERVLLGRIGTAIQSLEGSDDREAVIDLLWPPDEEKGWEDGR